MRRDAGAKGQGRRRPVTRLAAMLGRTRIALLLGVFAIGIGGCGGGEDGTIPTDESEALLSLLSAVQSSVSTGDCDIAEQTAAEVVDRVNNLPSDVDNELQEALTKASQQLVALANNPEECVGEGTSGPEGTDTTEPTTTEEEPTTTEEEPTTTDEEPTTTEEEPPPPEDEQPTEDPSVAPDNGQGNQGGGNGGGVRDPATGGVQPGGKR